MTPQLELRHLAIGFADRIILSDIELVLRKGQIGCLLGPSASGKTTLLRTIAGFETPLSGQVFIHGRVVSRPNWCLAPERRQVGMVFQDFALFPNLTVEGNIAFGLRGDQRIRERVLGLLKLIGLTEVASVYPHELSGGQQQRVALARAIAPRPEILLLDEPFSSIDPEFREQLAREVQNILRQEGITAIFVTHNQYEAFLLADEIGVIGDGSLLQWDSGYNLYHRPVNRFVANFIGRGVFLPGRVIDGQIIETALGVVQGHIPDGCKGGGPVDLLVRPDDVVIDPDGGTKARVVDKVFQGPTFHYTLALEDGAKLLCIAPSHLDYRIDDRIRVRLDAKHLIVFPKETPLATVLHPHRAVHDVC
ncbi:MAG: ABC transporter ATP-binding protein [Gammaproteobacteria bacterium]